MAELARKYQNGVGCPRDLGKALYWYKRAAEQNDPGALLALGDLNDAGVCVPEDVREAIRLYKRAADLGFAPAMVRLATMTERGRGLPFVPEDVLGWYRKAAEKGYGPAMTRLSDLDDGRTEDWLRKAVAAGHPPAFAKLAAIVETRNPEEARELYKRGASQGDGAALTAMGRYTESSIPVEAARYFRAAAEAGDPAGMARYAAYLESGKGQVPQSTGAAVVWYRKAAAVGEPSALTRMGELHEQGAIVSRNVELARILYKKAVDAGYAPALTRLGRLMEGEEPARAQALYRAAAEAGDLEGMVHYARTLSPAEAQPWYIQAAERKQPDALAALGRTEQAADAGHIPSMLLLRRFEQAARAGSPEGMRMYAETLSDPAQSGPWFVRGAEAGDARAMVQAGIAYAEGRGVPQDTEKARKWLNAALERGEAEGAFRLGLLDNNPAQYREAAEAGYPPAMVKVGDLTGDKSWYQRAADAGLANGWTKLGQVERGARAGAGRPAGHRLWRNPGPSTSGNCRRPRDIRSGSRAARRLGRCRTGAAPVRRGAVAGRWAGPYAGDIHHPVTAPAGLVSASTCSSLVSTDSQPGPTLPAIWGMAAASLSSRSCTSRTTVPPAGPGSKLTLSSVSKDGPCLRCGPINPHRKTRRRSATSASSSQSKPPTITPSSAFQVRQAPPGALVDLHPGHFLAARRHPPPHQTRLQPRPVGPVRRDRKHALDAHHHLIVSLRSHRFPPSLRETGLPEAIGRRPPPGCHHPSSQSQTRRDDSFNVTNALPPVKTDRLVSFPAILST